MSSNIGMILNQSLILSQKSVAYLANDLANLNTPDYQAQSLSWQATLGAAMQSGNGAVSAVQGQVVTATGLEQPDGSSVDLTATMSALAQAQMLYELAGTGLSTTEQDLQTAANLTTP